LKKSLCSPKACVKELIHDRIEAFSTFRITDLFQETENDPAVQEMKKDLKTYCQENIKEVNVELNWMGDYTERIFIDDLLKTLQENTFKSKHYSYLLMQVSAVCLCFKEVIESKTGALNKIRTVLSFSHSSLIIKTLIIPFLINLCAIESNFEIGLDLVSSLKESVDQESIDALTEWMIESACKRNLEFNRLGTNYLFDANLNKNKGFCVIPRTLSVRKFCCLALYSNFHGSLPVFLY
jgi:hypothetical protein